MIEILAFSSVVILAVGFLLYIGSGEEGMLIIPAVLLGAGWLGAAIVGWV